MEFLRVSIDAFRKTIILYSLLSGYKQNILVVELIRFTEWMANINIEDYDATPML